MPTLRALECLVAVLDTGSVTAAAARLHLSQPALSHQLAGLERELGATLLERLPQGVRPTAAGRAMAADARAAIQAAGRAADVARAVSAGSAGHLRIGSAESLTVALLAPALRSWKRRHPDVQVSLEEAESANTLNTALADGRLDLVVSPCPDKPAGPLVSIGEEEIVVAMPRDHGLASRKAAPTFADIADERLVHYHPDNGLRQWLDQCGARSAVMLRPAIQTRHAGAAALLAAGGLGVALVPTTAVRLPFPGRLRRLRPRLTRQIVVVSSGTGDTLEVQLREEMVRRGVPVPGALARLLDHPS